MEGIDLAAIISVAFFGSLGHCSGMCGGFVVAYSSTKIDASLSRYVQVFAHLLYNLGRVTTYAGIGALFGFLGAMIAFERTSQGILYAIIALVMVLMGLSILGKSSFMTRLESFSFFDRYLKTAFTKLIRSRTLPSFYALGLLNGLLPCGFVYFFAVTAASTASIIDGAIVMALFGIATIPILFTMGFFVGFLQKPGLRNMMNKVAGWIVTAYGFYMLYKGYLFLFTEAPSCH